jgi:hypothetical protein
MNKQLLKVVCDNLTEWVIKSNMESIPQDKKLNIIMMSLADICVALATDGTEKSIEEFHANN